tara:strand:+ start:275 stop:484 length:210 start_codon:yes stop_codon:yes gene_type:complete
MEFTEILNELEQIKRDVYKLGFTDNKENENYNEALDLVDRLHTTHNDIYGHCLKNEKLLKDLSDLLKNN